MKKKSSKASQIVRIAFEDHHLERYSGTKKKRKSELAWKVNE